MVTSRRCHTCPNTILPSLESAYSILEMIARASENSFLSVTSMPPALELELTHTTKMGDGFCIVNCRLIHVVNRASD